MSDSPLRSNPFATRWTRPGTIPFALPAGVTWDDLCQRVATQRRLQLLGPHGVGKSTLLADLVPRLRALGWRVDHLAVQPDGTTRVAGLAARRQVDMLGETSEATPPTTGDPPAAGARKLVVIDGWQQLPLWLRLGRYWSGGRLLATTHVDLGWPILQRLQPDSSLICQLARRLQQDSLSLVNDMDVQSAFEQTAGNLRETLFRLYDLWEQRAPSAATTTASLRRPIDEGD